MTEFAQNILALLGKSEAEIRPLLPEKHGGFSPRPASLHLLGRSAVLAGSEDGVPLLLVVADSRRRLPDGFEGEQTALADGGVLLRCGHSAANAAALRRHFPWCAPSAPPACALSAGVRLDGEAAERIGLFARNGVFPVLSGDGTAAVRAVFEIFSCDCRSGYAVDGGRAGTVSACEAALTGGATFITLSRAKDRRGRLCRKAFHHGGPAGVFLQFRNRRGVRRPVRNACRLCREGPRPAVRKTRRFRARHRAGRRSGADVPGGASVRDPGAPAEKSGDFHSFFALAGGAGGVRFRVPAACIDRPHLRGVPARGSV